MLTVGADSALLAVKKVGMDASLGSACCCVLSYPRRFGEPSLCNCGQFPLYAGYEFATSVKIFYYIKMMTLVILIMLHLVFLCDFFASSD